ncbi:hypothetical protein D3C71_1897300 [compost metagenome]
MNDALFGLHLAAHRQHAAREQDLAQPVILEQLGPDHDIGHPGLVFERHENHPTRRAGALAHQYQPGHFHHDVIGNAGKIVRPRGPPRHQHGSEKPDRMPLERK